MVRCEWAATITTPTGTSHIRDPNRRPIALDKDGWPVGSLRSTHEAHASLVELLLREGWEPAGTGSHWWQHRFRRPVQAADWETCEIVYRGNRWWADVVGPDGQYIADRTRRVWTFYATTTEKGRDAFDALVERLHADGWEQLDERGSEWWEVRFRRTVNKD